MKATVLVAGTLLIVFGVGTALTAARPDDGLDHGGNPCSAALFEALGLGSEDDLGSSSPGDAARSATKGTIAYCRDAARERLAFGGAFLGVGVAVLIARRRMRPTSGAAEVSAVP